MVLDCAMHLREQNCFHPNLRASFTCPNGLEKLWEQKAHLSLIRCIINLGPGRIELPLQDPRPCVLPLYYGPPSPRRSSAMTWQSPQAERRRVTSIYSFGYLLANSTINLTPTPDAPLASMSDSIVVMRGAMSTCAKRAPSANCSRNFAP